MLPTLLAGLAVLLVAAAQHGMVMFHAPRWSPDGQWLVLSSNIDGDDEEIWVMSVDGKVRRKLTDNAVTDAGADWLADGRRIAFQRQTATGVEHLVMNADGSGVQKHEPAHTRSNGDLTVEARNSGNRQAIVVRQKGTPERRISQVAWAEQPSISPDGRWVIFEQRDNPHDILSSDIAIWDARNGQLRILARATDPSWSPDGRTVLCKTPRGPENLLWIAVVDLATGQLRPLAPGVHPQFSPDGRSIVYMGESTDRSIAMSTDRYDRADVFVIGADGSQRRCLTCSWK